VFRLGPTGLLYMPKVSATPGDVDGAFEQFAFVEDCACPDEGHQVLGVDGPPAGLCCINELVGHGNTGCTGAGSFGDFGPQPYGGKRQFDWVGGAQMNPVLGRLCGLAGYVVMAEMKKENRDLAAARTWARR
jgi:hypothetical protein